MAGAKLEITIDDQSLKQMDETLAAIAMAARGPAVTKAIRDVGRVIATRTRAVLPKPGYERFTRTKNEKYKDKHEPKPLEATPTTKVIDRAGGVIKVGIIGYAWPAGAHGHLVEQGHRMVTHDKRQVGTVAPAEYMIRVVVETRELQRTTLINSVRTTLLKASK